MSIQSLISARARRVIDIVLATSIVLLASNGLIQAAFAAGQLGNASNTLSDPRPNAPAASVTHTLSWQAATSATLKCFTYRYSNSGSSGQGTTPTGFSNTGATNGTFTGLTAANWTINNTTAGTVQETYSTGASVTNGTQVTTPILSLTNPTNVSGETDWVEIKTFSDTGCTALVDTTIVAFATTPGVLVSATVDPTLTFAVAGVAASTTYKGALSTASNCTDTATAVTYGSPSSPLAQDTNYDCAQTLTTSTNASNGYQVTVQGKQASGDFLANVAYPTQTITNWTGTNASPTATPTSGSSKVFGYTTNGTLSGGTPTRFSSADNLFAGLTTTADQVAYKSTAISNDAVNVGLRLRFTGTTAAGSYQGTLVYTCTPTF